MSFLCHQAIRSGWRCSARSNRRSPTTQSALGPSGTGSAEPASEGLAPLDSSAAARNVSLESVMMSGSTRSGRSAYIDQAGGATLAHHAVPGRMGLAGRSGRRSLANIQNGRPTPAKGSRSSSLLLPHLLYFAARARPNGLLVENPQSAQVITCMRYARRISRDLGSSTRARSAEADSPLESSRLTVSTFPL